MVRLPPLKEGAAYSDLAQTYMISKSAASKKAAFSLGAAK